MTRRGLLPALALVALLVAVPAAGFGPPAHETPCQKLNGHDLTPRDKSVKLVERDRKVGGRVLLGCVPPRGKILTVARSGPKYQGGSWFGPSAGADDYTLLQVAGTHLLLDSGGWDESFAEGKTSVFDVTDGSSYDLGSWCGDLNPADESQCPATNETVERARINAKGQAAVILYTDEYDYNSQSDAKQVYVEGFRAGAKKFHDGKPWHTFDYSRNVDSIPAKSLKLVGSDVYWKHWGNPHHAKITE